MSKMNKLDFQKGNERSCFLIIHTIHGGGKK